MICAILANYGPIRSNLIIVPLDEPSAGKIRTVNLRDVMVRRKRLIERR